MESEKGVPVELYIYDLTNGLASILSPALLGKPPLLISQSADSELELGRRVEGVWHTAVVVYEREYFYGGSGVTSCAPGGTQLGAPHRVERLGETFVPFQVFVDYIQGLATSTYTGGAYRLLEHNCNHFSDEIAQFLCGARVPKHIVQQPEHALPPPLRLAVQALLDNLVPDGQEVYANGVRHSRRESPEYRTLNDRIEEARATSQALDARRSTLADKLARKERRNQKKRKKLCAQGDVPQELTEMSEVESAHAPAAAGPSSAPEQEERPQRAGDPPIVFRDVDGLAEFEKLVSAVEGMQLSEEERQSLEELQQYLVQGEGSWVLGDEFLTFVGRVLSDGGAGAAAAVRCLAAAALRDDVALLLHQDRRHHHILNYAHRIDRLPHHHQLALALLICNLFENISSSEWLMYISEWETPTGPLSNIQVTTKVCVHALLGEGELREVGTALAYNMATKEVKTVVFDEVSVELALALLQLLQTLQAEGGGEEHVHRAVCALARLVAHSPQVPALVALVGPDPAAFRGTSPRVDEQIELIMKRIK